MKIFSRLGVLFLLGMVPLLSLAQNVIVTNKSQNDIQVLFTANGVAYYPPDTTFGSVGAGQTATLDGSGGALNRTATGFRVLFAHKGNPQIYCQKVSKKPITAITVYDGLACHFDN